MTSEPAKRSLGYRVFGVGVMALAIVCLVRGDFDPGQPVPDDVPGRAALAYAAAVLMLVAGAAIEWRRTAAWGAATLTAYYALVVVVFLNGRLVLADYAEFGSYSNAAEQLAIAVGGLIVYAANAEIDPARAARLTRVGQLSFGVCALLFGGAHFFYLDLTALLTGVCARLAAVLLTIMFASFTVLVHTPMLVADPSSEVNWSESALNLAV